jgi:hypothetical protein
MVNPYPTWANRVRYDITNNPGSGYQALFTTDFVTGMNTDFSDIRFSDGTDTILPYFPDSITDSTTASFYVRLTASNILYLHYGNASASSEGNGHDVFPIFSDGTEITDFTEVKSGSSSAVIETVTYDSKSCIHLSGAAGTISNAAIKSTATVTNNFMIVIRNRVDNERYWDTGFGSGSVMAENGGTTDWWHTVLAGGYSFSMQTPVSGDNAVDAYIREISTEGLAANIATYNNSFSTLNAWHTLKMSYSSSGELKLTHDTTEILSVTDTTFLNSAKYVFVTQGKYSDGIGGNRYIDYIYVRTLATTEPTFTLASVSVSKEFTSSNDIGLLKEFTSSNDIFLNKQFTDSSDIHILKAFSSTNDILSGFISKIFESTNDILVSKEFSASSDILVNKEFSSSNDIEAIISKLFSSSSDIHVKKEFTSSNDICVSVTFSSTNDILTTISKLFSSSSDIHVSSQFSSSNDIRVSKQFSSSNDIEIIVVPTELDSPFTVIINKNTKTVTFSRYSRTVRIN